jgi:parallel beta-helix repeat protein
MDRAITLTAAKNITFRGTGAKREDVLLDFAKQSAGDGGVSGAEGVLVTTEGFTIEKLWIKNTAGNGIKVQANNSTFRNIKVGWDKTQTSNGAYALYPVNATNTLMEDNEVYGAADAGIYAGQCTHVIARGNVAHDNVLGIEIENTTDADIYKNEVYNNTCGFLIDLLPGLDKKDSKNYLVHDNKIHDNNLPNFGVAKTLAGVMPQGTGMFVYGGSDREITKNTFENNDGVALNISSQDAIDFFAPSSLDPKTSRWPERIYVHDNTFVHNGTNPVGIWGALAPSNDAGKKVMPYNILWDGILAHPEDGGAYYTTPNAAAAKICLGATEQTSFLNAHIVPGDATSLGDQARWTTDPTDHKCTLPALPALTP